MRGTVARYLLLGMAGQGIDTPFTVQVAVPPLVLLAPLAP